MSGDDSHASCEEAGFTEQVLRYLDDALDEGELAALHTRLRSSAGLRQQFVDTCLRAQLLSEALLVPLDRVGSLEKGADELAAGGAPETDSDAAASGHGPSWRLPRERAQSRRVPRFRWAAAILLPLLAGAALFWLLHPRRSSAILTAELDAVWGSDQRPTAGQRLPTGTVFLKSGLASIALDSGATIIVEGPAHFEATAPLAVTLFDGRLTATVPARAHGFAVQTPSARVVDLGTEFGVEAREDHLTHVEVFRGTVQTNALRPSDPAEKPRALTQGDAVEITPDAQAVRPVTPQPQAFVRAGEMDARARWTSGPGYERWLAYSNQVRRDPALALYYTFDDQAQSPKVLKNHAEATVGRYDIPLGPNAPTWANGRWPGHKALDFNFSKHQRLLLRDYPLATTGELTVAAWVYSRPRPDGWGTIAKSWAGHKFGQFYFGLEQETDADVAINEPDGRQTSVREGPFSPLPVGRWVHLAFVTDGLTLQLYHNGRLVGSTRCAGPTSTPALHTLAIGYKTLDDGVTPVKQTDHDFWSGMIGEFALFHRPLSADEIYCLYETGRPAD